MVVKTKSSISICPFKVITEEAPLALPNDYQAKAVQFLYIKTITLYYGMWID